MLHRWLRSMIVCALAALTAVTSAFAGWGRPRTATRIPTSARSSSTAPSAAPASWSPRGSSRRRDTAGRTARASPSASIRSSARGGASWAEPSTSIPPARRISPSSCSTRLQRSLRPHSRAGAVDELVKGTPVTSVGYGYSGIAADGSFVYDALRRSADSPVKKSSTLSLTVSTREAGPCLGDSGGPQLAGDTVLSVTSAGSKDCSGTADGYRLDSASARAFLGAFVQLP